jgi:hypothetical protein
MVGWCSSRPLEEEPGSESIKAFRLPPTELPLEERRSSVLLPKIRSKTLYYLPNHKCWHIDIITIVIFKKAPDVLQIVDQ